MRKNERFYFARIGVLALALLAGFALMNGDISAAMAGGRVHDQTNSNGKQTKKPKKFGKQKMDQTKRTTVSPGDWGGTGIRLVVGSKTTAIEYDCGQGEITDVLKVDKNGNFDAKGSHTRQMPGPTRQDRPDTPEPAHYTGKITGDRMTLKVTITDKEIQVGDFQLELGKKVRLHKCL